MKSWTLRAVAVLALAGVCGSALADPMHHHRHHRHHHHHHHHHVHP